MDYKREFFKIYDRKIANGEITFSQTTISREDFTKMCTEPDFFFNEDVLERVMNAMKMTEEEKEMFRTYFQ